MDMMRSMEIGSFCLPTLNVVAPTGMSSRKSKNVRSPFVSVSKPLSNALVAANTV